MNELRYSKDTLTSAFTRKVLADELRKLRDIAEQHDTSVAIVMFDFDHFKAINDNYGHIMGDLVLKNAIQAVINQLRTTDRVFRYGGEEFGITLPDTTIDTAIVITERLRSSIAKLEVCFSDKCIHFTASFGISPLLLNQGLEDTLNSADSALYISKSSGRNKVTVAPQITHS